MSATLAGTLAPTVDRERHHRWRLYAAYGLAIAMLVALAAYGFDYYTLDAAHRPLSPKHAALKPSGYIGIKLGVLGLTMFCAIFVYALRKRWKWLSRQGSSKHWLDFHVLMGLTAPFVIAFHSSFKFRGFAGMAFWIMLAVAISGIIGRYVYGQIPRTLNSAEITMAELREAQERLAERLAAQRILPSTDLQRLLWLPSAERVATMPMLSAVGYMVALDVARPFRVAKLRRRSLSFGDAVISLGGLLPTSHAGLEQAIAAAKEQSALGKRVVFLSRAQQVFQLWHVVHRPFSYGFAVLALIHIGVVGMLGFLRF